jgi:hypothetical protein
MGSALQFIFGLLIWIVIISVVVQTIKQKKLEAKERQVGNKQIVCPHCQTKGTVKTEPTRVKQGISGGKATAGLLTGGLSILATGLSQKHEVLKATCHNCKTVWYI